MARRIVDRHVLQLIRLWLKVPVEERDGEGKRRMGGGKTSKRGTPQGGVMSPMLANLYMNRFLKHWRLTRRGEAFRAHVVYYADDFVILSRGCAEEALAWTKAVMTKLGLTLNEAKTSVRDARSGTLRLPRLQCAAETWKGVLHERLKSCLKAAQMMRAGPSGSAFRSGSQTTPSCCVQKAWW